MKNFIKSIFLGNKDDETKKSVHNEFIKFGKGEYRDKYLIEAKRKANSFSLKTSSEFTNFLVRFCLNTASERLKISGIIISTFDLREGREYVFSPEEKTKRFMGIKQLSVDYEISKKDLLELMERYPRVFYALSFSTPSCELKIKAKAPKSSKPSASGEKEAKADFCSLKTTNSEIIKELLFDLQDFKEAKINHTLVIESISYPKDEKEPEKIRELSARKGKIIRKVMTDGRTFEKEAEFEG